MRSRGLFCSCRITPSVEITNISHSLLVNQLAIELKSAIKNDRRGGQQAGSSVCKVSSNRTAQKPFSVYRVPACCYGNTVQDLNTSLCLPPCYSFILFPPAPPGSHISFHPAWWLSLMLPCLCHHSSGVCLALCPLPCLLNDTLQTASSYWFHDSVNALIKYTPNANWFLRTQKQLTCCLCKHT